VNTEKNKIIKLAAVSIAVTVFVFIYSGIGKLNFFVIDDAWMLLGFNLVVPHSYSWNWVVHVFTDINNFTYSPIITLYYNFIYKLNGFDPYYYHTASLIIQFTDAVMLYFLSKRILNSFSIANFKIIAYLTSFIWLVHPLNVEAIVWISAIKFGLSNLFIFISFIYYIDGLNTNSSKKIIVSTLMFVCACMCKEQAIFAPYFFIGYTICHIKKWKYNQSLKWVGWSTLIMVSSFVFVYININANNEVYFAPASSYAFWQRICFAAHSLFFYLEKLVFPYPLKFYYTFPIKPKESLPWEYIISPVAFILFYSWIFHFFKKREQTKFFIFCSIFFFANMVFCLQIIPMGVRTNLVASRYMYLPAIPVLYLLLSILPVKVLTTPRIGYLFIVILLLATYTYFYVISWAKLNIS